jgi:hypothetical protein
MDYDKIISATYNWFSLDKLMWFLVFFWLSFFVLVFVPLAFRINWFAQSSLWVINSLVGIIYLVLILMLMVLTSHTLKHNKFDAKDISFTRIIDTIFLVFLELWYIFVWNLHKAYRVTQLLLLFGLPLLLVYSLAVKSLFIDLALLIFAIGYGIIVVYNSIRLIFSVMLFYHKDLKIKKAIKEAWHLTHKKFWKILLGVILAIAALFVVFAIITIVFGAIVHLILLNFFTNPIAYELAVSFSSILALAPVLVGYYFAMTEMYSQLIVEDHSSRRIKRILAGRVISPRKKQLKKKKASKKNLVKKKIKKKTVKKRKTKKKVVKKKTAKRKVQKKKRK